MPCLGTSKRNLVCFECRKAFNRVYYDYRNKLAECPNCHGKLRLVYGEIPSTNKKAKWTQLIKRYPKTKIIRPLAEKELRKNKRIYRQT